VGLTSVLRNFPTWGLEDLETVEGYALQGVWSAVWRAYDVCTVLCPRKCQSPSYQMNSAMLVLCITVLPITPVSSVPFVGGKEGGVRFSVSSDQRIERKANHTSFSGKRCN
jgi:hypothetical protein